MKSYVLQVTLERDEDAWRAVVPELESRGAATWGMSRDEALKNIQEVAQLVVEELLASGEPLPESVEVLDGPTVAVIVG